MRSVLHLDGASGPLGSGHLCQRHLLSGSAKTLVPSGQVWVSSPHLLPTAGCTEPVRRCSIASIRRPTSGHVMKSHPLSESRMTTIPLGQVVVLRATCFEGAIL